VSGEDAGLSFDHLPERPERDALPVRQRATMPPMHELRQGLDVREQLGDQTALSDPRYADDCHELRRRLLPRASERGDELVELALPSHEWRAKRCSLGTDSSAGLGCLPN